MSRRIQTESYEASGGPAPDKYWDRLLKYIPAEIVGGWVALVGVIASASSGPTDTALWIVFAIVLILTPIYMWRQTSKPGKPVAVTQIVISTLAFPVWVFALGGPFQDLSFYQPWLGSIVLILFTMIAGLIVPTEG